MFVVVSYVAELDIVIVVVYEIFEFLNNEQQQHCHFSHPQYSTNGGIIEGGGSDGVFVGVGDCVVAAYCLKIPKCHMVIFSIFTTYKQRKR